LEFELWIGDAAEIRTKRVRKQKTDHLGSAGAHLASTLPIVFVGPTESYF